MNLLTVPDNWLFELICFSSNWLARPLWSPLINWLELFIDVQWSGNQLITPIGLLVFKSNMFNWETIWSVLCLYLEVTIEEKAWLQKRLVKWGMNWVNYLPQWWVEFDDELSWLFTKRFILFAENSQILLKISVIPIFLTFIYLVALNLLVNNQLNSSSNSSLRHIIVTHTNIIVVHTWRRISSVTRWTPRCWGRKCILRCSHAGWPTMRPWPMPEPEPLLWLAEHAMLLSRDRDDGWGWGWWDGGGVRPRWQLATVVTVVAPPTAETSSSLAAAAELAPAEHPAASTLATVARCPWPDATMLTIQVYPVKKAATLTGAGVGLNLFFSRLSNTQI